MERRDRRSLGEQAHLAGCGPEPSNGEQRKWGQKTAWVAGSGADPASRRPGRCPLLRGGLLRARSWVTVPLGSPRGRLHPPRCLISFTIIPLGPPLLLPVETLRVTGSILLTVHLWRAALGFFPELGYCGDYGDAHVFVK